MTPFRTKRALTLVEVLIFAWVLTLLVCIFIGWHEPKKRTGHGLNCLGYLRQVCLAMKAYANDDIQNQLFPMVSPSPASSNELFQRFLVDLGYVRDVKVFRCPSDKLRLPT
jgi:hypothetical protein